MTDSPSPLKTGRPAYGRGNKMSAYLENDAVISDCGHYRYLLRRSWDAKRPRAALIMLNPSTADAYVDDATIRSCVRLLSALQYGSMEVVNLFAWRATDPDELRPPHMDRIIGKDNDGAITRALERCDIPICAWGSHKAASYRERHVVGLIRTSRPVAFCFGKTKSGAPKHPLYIKTGTPLEAYP